MILVLAPIARIFQALLCSPAELIHELDKISEGSRPRIFMLAAAGGACLGATRPSVLSTASKLIVASAFVVLAACSWIIRDVRTGDERARYIGLLHVVLPFVVGLGMTWAASNCYHGTDGKGDDGKNDMRENDIELPHEPCLSVPELSLDHDSFKSWPPDRTKIKKRAATAHGE